MNQKQIKQLETELWSAADDRNLELESAGGFTKQKQILRHQTKKEAQKLREE